MKLVLVGPKWAWLTPIPFLLQKHIVSQFLSRLCQEQTTEKKNEDYR